jgi:hypothetical protein
LYFFTNEITGERKARLSKSHMTVTDPRSPFFELVPRFECSSAEPEEWGTRPSAPNGREELVDGIIETWRDKSHSSFILFVDGNPGKLLVGKLEVS